MTTVDSLLDEYEYHGNRLVPHQVVAMGQRRATLQKRISRALDRLERGWRPSRLDLDALAAQADCPDVWSALAQARGAGATFPTLRAFTTIAYALVPELRGRERLTLSLQARGRGPRACPRCGLGRQR